MYKTPQRRLALAGAQNIRDLGGYRAADGRETRWRRVYRGDGLHRLTPDGVMALGDVGLSTVIDLRSRSELENDPNPITAHPGITFRNKPVYDDLAPAMMATRKGRSDSPLLDFYLIALSHRTDAIRDILSTIAAAPQGPVLFHCTAGKDRTGIIAALLLGTAGVGRQTIIDDYTLTGEFIGTLVQDLLERTRQSGGDTEQHARFLTCDPPTMAAMLDHIEARHGSIPGYLSDIGVTRGEISALRDRLLADI